MKKLTNEQYFTRLRELFRSLEAEEQRKSPLQETTRRILLLEIEGVKMDGAIEASKRMEQVALNAIKQ